MHRVIKIRFTLFYGEAPLQQIAGGIGIALFVGIMSSGANRYLHHSLDPTAMHEKTQSMVSGLQTVFWIEFICAILILVLGWFISSGYYKR